MKAIAKRGNITMLLEDGVTLGDRSPVTLRNELTGEEFPSFYQQALKWGYWEPVEAPKMVIRRKKGQ